MSQMLDRKKHFCVVLAVPLAVFLLTLFLLNITGEFFATVSAGYVIAVLIIFFAVELLLETFKCLIKGRKKTVSSENVDEENCKLYYERDLDRISYLASFLAIVCSENEGMMGGPLVAASVIIIIFFACRAFKKCAR